MEARLISAWFTDVESKCGQEKEGKTYMFFACAGRYFWDIFSSMVRTGAGDRVAKSRQLKVKVKCKAL